MPPTLLIPGSIANTTEIPIKYITSWLVSHMFEYGYNNATLNDRILIIQAETGSGKSTVMPVEIFRILRNKDSPSNVSYRGYKVLCTQPRVLTAIELARTVSSINSSWNPDIIFGKIVGYSTGPKKERAYGLIYATAGSLRAKLNNNTDDDIMSEYKFIIIDEAHERSVDSDVLLFMLYKFYKRNEGNKRLPFLILTSATFDTNKYANYFDVSIDNIIKVKGSQFNIHPHWLPHDTSNVYDTIVDTLVEINKIKDDPQMTDVLIFAPGMGEMKEIEKYIKKRIMDYLLILKLDGSAVRKMSSDYTLVFESYNKLPKLNGRLPTRRVVLSTSVAETGLTINTLKYVIDMGFHKGSESYPISNIGGLVTRPATKSRITQRRGRCGRLFDGEFYPMYTKETFEELDDQQLPDILTSTEEYNMVHLSFYRLLNNTLDINELNLLDKPSQESFIGANSVATLLGFVYQNKLTDLGLIASKFTSISMEAAKVIFSGFAYNVAITDLITIAALFQTEYSNLFMRDNMYKKFMESIHKKINFNVPCNAHIMKSILPEFIIDLIDDKDNDIFYYRYKTIICDDFIESLLAFESFVKQIILLKNNKKIIEWCQIKCINYSGIQDLYEARDKIIEELLTAGIDIMYGQEYRLIDQSADTFIQTVIKIKKCLYEGLKHNLLEYDNTLKTYKTIHNIPITITNSILSTQLQNKLKTMGIISEDIIPKFILTNHINLSAKRGDFIMYEIKANFISILDGYVYPDTSMGEPNYSDDLECNVEAETESESDNTIELYHLFNSYITNDIKMPVCKLTNNMTSLFNKVIIKNIVEPYCYQ